MKNLHLKRCVVFMLIGMAIGASMFAQTIHHDAINKTVERYSWTVYLDQADTKAAQAMYKLCGNKATCDGGELLKEMENALIAKK